MITINHHGMPSSSSKELLFSELSANFVSVVDVVVVVAVAGPADGSVVAAAMQVLQSPMQSAGLPSTGQAAVLKFKQIAASRSALQLHVEHRTGQLSAISECVEQSAAARVAHPAGSGLPLQVRASVGDAVGTEAAAVTHTGPARVITQGWLLTAHAAMSASTQIVTPGMFTGAAVGRAVGSEVVGASVTGAEVVGAELTGAEVVGAELTGAEVTGAVETAVIGASVQVGTAARARASSEAVHANRGP